MSNKLYNEQHLQKVDIVHFLAAPMGAAFYKNQGWQSHGIEEVLRYL